MAPFILCCYTRESRDRVFHPFPCFPDYEYLLKVFYFITLMLSIYIGPV